MADRADKLVVLAAGKGTRMRRESAKETVTDQQRLAAATGVKALIPVGRPFLDYVLHRAADAGLTDICIVTGPGHETLRQYYRTLPLERLQIEFALQHQPLGTANAVAAAESYVGNDPFLVVNSDNCYPSAVLQQLRQLDGPAVAGFDRDALVDNSNLTADRIARFAILEPDEHGCLARIVEKPPVEQVRQMTPPVFVGMNCWRFTPHIFRSCRAIDRSSRGEFELPDAVNHSMHELGERYTLVKSAGPVFDLSHQSDIAEVTKFLQAEEVRL